MRRSVLAIALALIASAPAGALTVIPLDWPDLVSRSAAIVYGRVRDVRGQWTADRRGIESVVTADVLSSYKGRAGSSVTFVTPGGHAGGFAQLVPGAPALAEGDLVVLFLTERGPRLPITTGLTQGVWRVTIDARSGTATVMAPPADAAARVTRGDPARRPIGLGALAAEIAALASPAPVEGAR